MVVYVMYEEEGGKEAGPVVGCVGPRQCLAGTNAGGSIAGRTEIDAPVPVLHVPAMLPPAASG